MQGALHELLRPLHSHRTMTAYIMRSSGRVALFHVGHWVFLPTGACSRRINNRALLVFALDTGQLSERMQWCQPTRGQNNRCAA